MMEAESGTSTSLYNLASPAGRRSMPENINGDDGLRSRHHSGVHHHDHPPLPPLDTSDALTHQMAPGSAVRVTKLLS